MSESISEDTYWQSRATTAEEKVKEWSVRACEAEQHIAKAREIIQELWIKGRMLIQDKERALKVLEGK